MSTRSFAKNESSVLTESTRQRLGMLLGKKKAPPKSAVKSPPKVFGLEGGSALGPLAEGAYWIACSRGDAQKAQEALESGAKAWSLSRNGREAELFALSHGDTMVDAIKKAGAPPPAWIERHGARALEIACEAKAGQCVEWLIQKGLSAQAIGPGGKSPLAIAFARRWPEGARLILKAGASLHPVGAHAKSWESLLDAWRQFLNHGLGPDAQVLQEEWVRRGNALPATNGLSTGMPSKVQRQTSKAQGGPQEGAQPLLPGLDWSSTPAPGEMAAALKRARERNAAKSVGAQKKPGKKPF